MIAIEAPGWLAARVHFWLRALLTLVVLLASLQAFAHACASSGASANAISAQPSGPPRPGEARRKAGPGRAQLASAPGRVAPTRGGAAPLAPWGGRIRALKRGYAPGTSFGAAGSDESSGSNGSRLGRDQSLTVGASGSSSRSRTRAGACGSRQSA